MGADEVDPGAEREVDVVENENEQIADGEQQEVDGQLLLGFLVEEFVEKEAQRHAVAVEAEQSYERDENDVEPFGERVKVVYAV